jgi:hypothetical protein
MYYSEKGAYKRGSGGQTITFENSAIVVHAHMEGSTYHPLLNISVIPQVKILNVINVVQNQMHYIKQMKKALSTAFENYYLVLVNLNRLYLTLFECKSMLYLTGDYFWSNIRFQKKAFTPPVSI